MKYTVAIRKLSEEREAFIKAANNYKEQAEKYEASALKHRRDEAKCIDAAADIDAAIADLEAADRRRRLYGQEVVQ